MSDSQRGVSEAAGLPALALRQQLHRMMRHRFFAAQPRTSSLLRYVVEESIRTGHAPLGQRLIAVHGLGLSADFSPTRSAEVRVKVARLRRALGRYYAGPGRDDPVVLTVSQGPYRLMVADNQPPSDRQVAAAAGESRRTRPMLLVVEPRISGGRERPAGLAADISLRLGGLLAESSVVNASGPLPRGRIAGGTEPPAALAAALGYDAVAESEIDTTAPAWAVRMITSDTRRGEPAQEFTGSFAPDGTVPPAEAIAIWMYHRISDSVA